jgi:hypothetical protein
MDTGEGAIVLIGIAAIVMVAVVMFVQHHNKTLAAERIRERYMQLMRKYNDQQVVEAIMQNRVWQGMSDEQLIDSRGAPEDKDQTVYKTKTKETWKYGRIGRNRFQERIYVENGTVVGWKD